MRLILYLILLMLLGSQAQAQTSQKYMPTGALAGQEIASKAQLLKHAYPHQFPLRLVLMPWYSPSKTAEWKNIQTEWIQALEKTESGFKLQTAPDFVKTQMQEKTFPLAEPTWKKLSFELKADLFLQTQLIPVGKKYWFNLQLIEGITGNILANEQKELEQLDLGLCVNLTRTFLSLQAQARYPHIIDIGSETDPGEVHLETTPTEMSVYLNEDPVGQSPLILRYVPAGLHQLRFQEFKPFRYQILRIYSEPSGIEVWLNNQYKGQTPLALPSEQLLTAGDYQLEFKSPNNFKANLEIQTQPEGVPFQLDNNAIVRTPITFEQLNKKMYNLKVLGNEQIQVREPLIIPPNPETPLQIKIEPYKFAKVVLDASEENTEVILDQELRGETPISLNLSPGLHTLELKKPRYKHILQSLDLEAGNSYSYNYQLDLKSVDTSIFLTPTGEISSRLNVSSKILGLGQFKPNVNSSTLNASMGSLEVDYGWPELAKFYDFLDLGLSVSGYVALLQKGENISSLQGVGAKLQLLKESRSVPVSVAVGSYLNIDFQNPKAVGFVSLSRNFFDFALHLGFQTHGMNLNIGYTGFDNWRLGFVVFANSLLGLLSNSGEEISTLYGLQAGYSF